jgi:hypothetical protein
MNRRDAIKAAVAGVATCALGVVAEVPPYEVMKVSRLPAIGTPWPPTDFAFATTSVKGSVLQAVNVYVDGLRLSHCTYANAIDGYALCLDPRRRDVTRHQRWNGDVRIFRSS